ncbi:MAG: NAD(P)-dependent alcohol dehydrogenase [Deltaproteobacteria bacterium]|nr:NAD(P)-dependent alcohol dehydrogenase [Deltaproteobacteria bacterium]
MQAAVYERYGSPQTLELREVPRPEPGPNEVLVKTQATTVTLVDTAFRSGRPWMARLFTGLLRPKNQILGTEFAGRVEAVGSEVDRFEVGDVVFGASDQGFGTHAEYVCVAQTGALAIKPSNITVGEAAAVSNGALTALPFLRDHAKLRPGQKILIIGASGSIGTCAVQLAKHFGAHVTGVCSTANVELVKSLGADRVIDYTKDDFTQGDEVYDVVFDTVGKSSFSRSKGVLTPRGIYMTTVISIGILIQTAWTSMFGGKKSVFAATGLRSTVDKNADLLVLKELIEAGTLRTIIDSHYSLGQIADAHRYVDTERKKGNVIIAIPNAA